MCWIFCTWRLWSRLSPYLKDVGFNSSVSYTFAEIIGQDFFFLTYTKQNIKKDGHTNLLWLWNLWRSEIMLTWLNLYILRGNWKLCTTMKVFWDIQKKHIHSIFGENYSEQQHKWCLFLMDVQFDFWNTRK